MDVDQLPTRDWKAALRRKHVLEYVRDLSSELAELARSTDGARIATLLDLASDEASRQLAAETAAHAAALNS